MERITPPSRRICWPRDVTILFCFALFGQPRFCFSSLSLSLSCTEDMGIIGSAIFNRVHAKERRWKVCALGMEGGGWLTRTLSTRRHCPGGPGQANAVSPRAIPLHKRRKRFPVILTIPISSYNILVVCDAAAPLTTGKPAEMADLDTARRLSQVMDLTSGRSTPLGRFFCGSPAGAWVSGSGEPLSPLKAPLHVSLTVPKKM